MLPMLPAASAGNLMNQYRNFIVFQTISLLRHVDRLTDSTAERLLPGAQQQIHLLLAFLVFLDDCGFKDCVCTVASSTPGCWSGRDAKSIDFQCHCHCFYLMFQMRSNVFEKE